MRANANVADDGYLPDTPPVEADMYDDGPIHSMDEDGVPMSDQHLPSSPIVKAVERKSQLVVKREQADEEDDLMEISQAVGHAGRAGASVNMSGSRPAPKPKAAAYPSPESSSPTSPPVESVDASVWNDVTTKLNVLTSSPPTATSFGKLNPQDALEEDGSLRMFWLDYTEVNGSLCLFGKVKDRSTGAFVSCFVKVDNILRKLFFLPREYRQRKPEFAQDILE